MTMKLKNPMESYEAKMKEYKEIRDNEKSTQEQVDAAFATAMEAYAEGLKEQFKNEVAMDVANQSMDTQILLARGQDVLTSEEKKFFNAVVEQGGFTDESVLPETTQQRVFENLVKEHPLLEALGIQDLGAATKFIYSDPTKAYAWKELFGPITGQVNTAFRAETMTQLKLTAFAVLPNDMLELGPEWVERYTRELLIESIASGLEYGFVNGRGPAQSEPVGLLKDVDSGTGAVTDKVSSGTLTFAPSDRGEVVAGELYGVISALSTNAAGDSRKVMNKVFMVVNPVDAIAINFRNTIQTLNGQWVTALPYNLQVIESDEVAIGKAAFFVQGEYMAAVAGPYRLKKYTETLAIEDATLYTIKRFANGRPRDNKAALVYDLNITFPAPAPETP